MTIDFKKYKNELIFLPIGGSKEIGLNCNLYHYNGKWLIVEMGIGFVKNIPGVEVSVPSLSFLKKIRRDIVGIVITHAHEDHIGAIPYVWEELRLPIYTSEFAKEFLKEKLSEYSFAKKVEIYEVDSKKEVDLKPFKLEFIGLTHSAPEMHAILIKTEKGNVLHTGDWKFDKNPVVGKVSDTKRLKELGKKNQILATVSDSTNIFKEGQSQSEGDLLDSLTKIIKKKKGMVIIGTFASNVARLKTILNVAKKCNRKVVLSGSSMLRNARIARKVGYLSNVDFVSEQDFKKYKRKELIVIATGCQGERNASMNKIASDEHKFIRANKDDTMIFSSKIIPGNEKELSYVFNKFAEREIEVITEETEFVHVSGHYTRDELKEMYKMTNPTIAVAIHGEATHILEHSKLALECGVKYAVKSKDGDVIKLSKNGAEKIGEVQTDFLAVDGTRLIPANSPIIKARRKILESGIIFVSLVMNEKYQLLTRPEIASAGAYDPAEDPELTEILEDDIIDIFKATVREIGLGGKNNRASAREKLHSTLDSNIRKAVNAIFKQENGKKPVMKIAFSFV